jgi:hypothetical protein
MHGSAVSAGIAPRGPALASRLSLRPKERALDAARQELRRRSAAAPGQEPHGQPSGEPRSVLIAGHDPLRRADVLEQLAGTMPETTYFEQVGTFWEVLVRAPCSRMVIISGELDDGPPESLQHTLARRHPDLPVMSFASRALATH